MSKQIKFEDSPSRENSPVKREHQPAGILVLHGKWRWQILSALHNGPVRLSLLQRCLKGVSKKVLHENLRVLEIAGVVERRDLTGRVPYIEYQLTSPLGIKLAGIVLALQEWKP